MGFVAEVEIGTPLLRAVTEANPQIELRMEDIVLGSQGATKFLFQAVGVTDEDVFVADLTADPTVGDYAPIEQGLEGPIYRVTFAETSDALVTYRVATDADSTFLDLRVQAGTARIRMLMPDLQALEQYREHCASENIHFELNRLYRELSTDPARFDLTDAQCDALVAAHDVGYFDSPRSGSLADVADRLDISRQAASGRVRRGLDRLLEATVAENQ